MPTLTHLLFEHSSATVCFESAYKNAFFILHVVVVGTLHAGELEPRICSASLTIIDIACYSEYIQALPFAHKVD